LRRQSKVQQLGGRIVIPPQVLPHGDRLAIVLDTERVSLGLIVRRHAAPRITRGARLPDAWAGARGVAPSQDVTTYTQKNLALSDLPSMRHVVRRFDGP